LLLDPHASADLVAAGVGIQLALLGELVVGTKGSLDSLTLLGMQSGVVVRSLAKAGLELFEVLLWSSTRSGGLASSGSDLLVQGSDVVAKVGHGLLDLTVGCVDTLDLLLKSAGAFIDGSVFSGKTSFFGKELLALGFSTSNGLSESLGSLVVAGELINFVLGVSWTLVPSAVHVVGFWIVSALGIEPEPLCFRADSADSAPSGSNLDWSSPGVVVEEFLIPAEGWVLLRVVLADPVIWV